MQTGDSGAGAPDRGRRPGLARRLLRSRWVRFGVPVLVVAVVAAVIAYGKLGEVPQERADEYAAAAAPVLAGVDASMNRTFLSLDGYIDTRLVPKSEFKGVDDIDELKRRLLPIQKESEEALKAARDRIANASKQIKSARTVLADVPDTAPLVDNAPIDAAEDFAAESAKLLDADRAHLRRYRTLIDYELAALKLDRRQLLALADDQTRPSDSLDELKAKLASLKGKLAGIRKEFLKLDPPADAEPRHDTRRQLLTIYVDYIDDIQAGLDALDVAALEAADDQFISTTRGLSDKLTTQLLRFANTSGLQNSSRKQTNKANELESRLRELSEAGLDEPKRWSRPQPTPLPDKSGTGKGDSGKLS